MPTSYRVPMCASMSGYYVLKFDCTRFRVITMDGAPFDILPHRIVQRVNWMDSESCFKRLWRKITGKMVILLPAPDTRFAVIQKKDFTEHFKEI